jgi:hypothetical protein
METEVVIPVPLKPIKGKSEITPPWLNDSKRSSLNIGLQWLIIAKPIESLVNSPLSAIDFA